MAKPISVQKGALTIFLIVDNGPYPRIIRQGHWIRSYLSGVEAEIVCAVQNRLPGEPERYCGVILTGGTEPLFSKAPWVTAELKLIERCADRNVPLLGICHGHQLIVRALIGDHAVREKYSPEFGWKKIRLLHQDSPLFDGIPPEFHVHCSHFDEVCELSSDFRLLAESDLCKIHAYECKSKPVWGVQFHSEISVTRGRILLVLGSIFNLNLSLMHPKTLWNTRDSGIAPRLFSNFVEIAKASSG